VQAVIGKPDEVVMDACLRQELRRAVFERVRKDASPTITAMESSASSAAGAQARPVSSKDRAWSLWRRFVFMDEVTRDVSAGRNGSVYMKCRTVRERDCSSGCGDGSIAMMA